MKHKGLIFLLLMSLWPLRCDQVNGQEATFDLLNPSTLQQLESDILTRSLFQLERRRYNLLNQGILVESLDGNTVLAELNSDVPFNPASVMKLATSFMALDRLGPDYRFHTVIYGQCPVNAVQKTLKGDLFLVSEGNPVFRPADARNLSQLLVRRGLKRVEGDLVVVGPFSLGANFPLNRAAAQMRRYLNLSGIRILGKTRLLPAGSVVLESKVHFLTHTSERLRSILWTQNAYSVNDIADRLGDGLGGPAAIRQFLMKNARLEPESVYVARPSGLEYNRMTARATVKMLRALYSWLAAHQMWMQDIMPVAGIDEGTLYGRFRDSDCQGAIVGKTGTNPSKDGGVSALAGIAYTRDYGPLLYAIFNTHGSVATYRRWQDDFLHGVMEVSGGVGQYLSPHLDMVNIYTSSSWTPSQYWASLTETPLISKKPPSKRAKFQPRKMAKNRRPGSRRARV
jgi:serine-type D-Ala-D-Ala carboxypeptidase/endopeptidase (penicillin-binding protein 4)